MTVSPEQLGLGGPLGRQGLARGTEMLTHREPLHQHRGIVTAVTTGLKVSHEGLEQCDGLGEGLSRCVGARGTRGT
jgi:hypothetical protein